MKFPKVFFIVLFLVFLDQITKIYFIGNNIEIFKYFSLNYVTNTGVAFGLFHGFNLFFIFISLLVAFFILYYYNKFDSYKVAFNLILAGILGNLIDRIFRGFVIDFINFKIWPVFNLADSFIVFGVLLLIYFIWKEKA